jgi:hypothetical protein
MQGHFIEISMFTDFRFTMNLMKKQRKLEQGSE